MNLRVDSAGRAYGTWQLRFLHYIEFGWECDCWKWVGTRNRDGYGQLRRKGKGVGAHRLAYEYFLGTIPSGMHVLHSCDNRRCVNPGHLFLGTHIDNMLDRKRKGRGPRGEASGKAKLTTGEVFEIRRLAAQGMPLAEIGSLFGITDGQISRIVNRKRWGHIP